MTAQMGEIFRHEGQEYICLRVEGGDLFNPHDYGFHPFSFSTACWRGYCCTYEVKDGALMLQELLINDCRGYYPAINGVSIPKREPVSDSFPMLGEDDTESHALHFGPETYKGLALPIPFTGRVLLGDDFDYRYYIHMGLQRPMGYRKLYSFSFVDGILQEITDHCKTAELLREIDAKESERCGGKVNAEDLEGMLGLLSDDEFDGKKLVIDTVGLRNLFLWRQDPLDLLPEEIRRTIWWE